MAANTFTQGLDTNNGSGIALQWLSWSIMVLGNIVLTCKNVPAWRLGYGATPSSLYYQEHTGRYVEQQNSKHKAKRRNEMALTLPKLARPVSLCCLVDPLCSAPRASFQTGFPAYSEPTWFWIYFLCEKLREHILDLFPTGIIPPPYINGRIMANWVFQLPIIKKHITYPFCRNSLYLVVHHVSWLDLAAF